MAPISTEWLVLAKAGPIAAFLLEKRTVKSLCYKSEAAFLPNGVTVVSFMIRLGSLIALLLLIGCAFLIRMPNSLCQMSRIWVHVQR